MQATRKRTPLFMAIAIGAVATMGLGFAMWNETLDVEATVDTGDLNVEFANVRADNCDPTSTSGDNGITVTVTDAVPNYTCVITADIVNDGTVDAKVLRIRQTGLPHGGITLTAGGIDDTTIIPKLGTVKDVTFTLKVPDNVDENLPAHEIGVALDFENVAP